MSQLPSAPVPTPTPTALPQAKRRVDWTTVILVISVVALIASNGYLFYQLQQTQNQLQHRIDLSNHFTSTCTGSTSADGLVFTETCTDNFGTVCTSIETFASVSNPTVVSSTTTCRPA